MEAIQNVLFNLSKLYVKRLIEDDPLIEFWSVKTDNSDKHMPPKGLGGMMKYTDVLKWMNENQSKYQRWHRFTFLDSKALNIFISFTIEEGEVGRPIFSACAESL